MALGLSLSFAHEGCSKDETERTGPPPAADDAGDAEPPDSAGPSCGDTSKDPKNCGRCGHDCLGGDCVAGMCKPVLVAKQEYEIDGMAVARDAIYFVSYHKMHLARCAFPCTGSVTELYKGTDPVMSVVVDGTSAFFSDWGSGIGAYGGAVRKCALPDCAGGPVSVVIGMVGPTDIALARSRLFWATSSGRIGAADSERTNVEATELVPRQVGFTMMAASADRLYWLLDNGGGELRSCALPDCADGPKTIASGFGVPRRITLTDDRVYWGNGTSIMACSMPDCAGGPAEIVGKLSNVNGLADDGKHLFWTSEDGVFECELPSCAQPTLLAPLFPNAPEDPDAGDAGLLRYPGMLATDGHAVVWADADGNVSFMALP